MGSTLENENMSNSFQPSAIPEYIQSLLGNRQKHVDAIASIDGTLAAVSAALNGSAHSPSEPAVAPSVVAMKMPKTTAKRLTGRGKFALSATESVLAFVKEHKNPTSRQINQHFKDEGRSTAADDSLYQLVKKMKLKRTPLGEGILGSRYSLV
jgi:hypothetical protein